MSADSSRNGPEPPRDDQDSGLSHLASQIADVQTLEDAVRLDLRLVACGPIQDLSIRRLRTLLEKRFVESVLVAFFLMGQDGSYDRLVEEVARDKGRSELWLSDLERTVAKDAVARASAGPRLDRSFDDPEQLAAEILVCRSPAEASQLIESDPGLNVPGVEAPPEVVNAVHEVSARVIVSAVHRRYLAMAASLMEGGLWNEVVERNLQEESQRLIDAGLNVYAEQRQQEGSASVSAHAVRDWLEMEEFLGGLGG